MPRVMLICMKCAKFQGMNWFYMPDNTYGQLCKLDDRNFEFHKEIDYRRSDIPDECIYKLEQTILAQKEKL